MKHGVDKCWSICNQEAVGPYESKGIEDNSPDWKRLKHSFHWQRLSARAGLGKKSRIILNEDHQECTLFGAESRICPKVAGCSTCWVREDVM